ncbi:MAG TPA: hypothetical protein VFW11_16240 [Cyclobacteriaceae bacterium]|nr:hypothetical protein [Cyclobacteriaceae bacterium]
MSSLGNRITKSHFFIKLTNWEHWPFGIVQLPSFGHWIWLSLKARSPVFFSASNPGIPMGGMFGESKFDILKRIPGEFIARSSLVTLPATTREVMRRIHDMGLVFPVIFKPDLGERGWMVERIHNETEVDRYLQKIKIDFLIQECIDKPLEFGVYYRRFPTENSGVVTSIVAKEMLNVTGNGRSSLQELIQGKDRARLQWEKLKIKFESRLDEIPQEGEVIELVSIGNHCLGTKFLDGGHLINHELTESFDRISKQVEGFYYGRFDLRVDSIQDLNKGNVKIMELNGCGAEPAHIYQPGYSLRTALVVLYRHWEDIFRISMENNKRGVNFTSLKDGIQMYRKFREAVKGS